MKKYHFQPPKTAHIFMLVILLVLFAFWNVGAQVGGVPALECGTISAPPPNGSNPDSLILDRFGNVYDVEDLLIPSSQSGSSQAAGGCNNTGIFTLTWDADFPVQNRPTVCQVFADLSNLIVPHSNSLVCGGVIPPGQVQIDIIWANNQNDPLLIPSPGILGTGTPFYSGPIDNCGSMILDRPFIKINGGIVAPLTPNIFDGRLVFNSDPESGGIQFTWHTNWTTPVAPNELDLYTVALHEALHILGFASRMDLTEHSLWDRILHITDNFIPNGISPNIQPILINNSAIGDVPCSGSGINCWGYSTAAGGGGANLPLLISNTCNNTNVTPDIVVGETAIAAIDRNNGGGVLNQLSHLSETCNGQNETYVMASTLTPGASKRVISDDELQIMCALGYEISTPTFNCAGCYSIADVDPSLLPETECCIRVFYGCVGDVIHIDDQDLLCNDVTSGAGQIITRVWAPYEAPNVVTVTQVPNGWDILFSPSASNTEVTFLYTVSGCDCRLHNNTFKVYREVCGPCDYEVDICENLLCVHDFEDRSAINGIWFGHPFRFSSHPALGTPDILELGGNNYLFLNNSTIHATEAVTLELQKCIEPGCDLALDFDASNNTHPGNLEIWGSLNPPCLATEVPSIGISDFCGIPTNCNSYTFSPICVADFAVSNMANYGTPDLNLLHYNSIWRNNTADEVCFLTLVPVGNNNGINLDNITAQIRCEPEITCNNLGPTDICQGEISSLSFQICAPEIPECIDITLVTPNVVLPPGWTLVGGNPNPFTLTEGGCAQVDFQVQMPPGTPISTTANIGLGGTATGLCTTVDWYCEVEVTVIDCGGGNAFTCPCTGTDQINIDASETNPHYNAALGGTLYSDLETAFNYDQNDDGIIDASEHHNCIAIAGRLIIDTDVAIQTCENVQMQPCAEIVVGKELNDRKHLTLLRNTIYSCNIMWKGITVEDNSWLTFIGNTIRDAEHAISAKGTHLGMPNITKIDVSDNIFRNNHIGVLLPQRPFKSAVEHIPFIYNIFETATGSLLLPTCSTNLENYNASQGGYAGLVTLGIPFTVGLKLQSGYSNTFRYLRNGIISQGANLDVQTVLFQHITLGTGPGNFPNSGAAVWSRNGRLAVHFSSVENTDWGIYADQVTKVTASVNSMTNVHRGIETVGVMGHDISGNLNMRFSDRAFYCRELKPVASLGGHRILDNLYLSSLTGTLNPDPLFQAAAIDMENALSAAMPLSAISNNHYSASDNTHTGIHVSGAGKFELSSNVVDFYLGGNQGAGIYLTNTNTNFINDNTVNDFGAVRFSTGMSLGIGTGNSFCCNTTNGNQYGSRFLGACAATVWQTTDMANHQFALYCEDGTVIGQQFDRGDLFNVGTGTAFHGGQDFDVLNSQFKVVDMLQPNWPEAISTPKSTAALFILGGSPKNCANPCISPGYEADFPDGDIRETDLLTAANSWQNGQYGDALQFENARRLFERMNDYEGMIGASASTDAFFNAAVAGKIGSYYIAERAAKDIAAYPNNIVDGLQTAIEQLSSTQEAVEAILEGLSQATKQEDSLHIYEAANTVYLSGQATADLGGYEAMAQAYQNNAAMSALALTNALGAENLLEQNRKTVQRIYLQSLGLGISNLSPAQFVEIESIAEQCPLEGGSAVFAARVLYHLNQDRAFVDDSLCIAAQERTLKPKASIIANEIQVMPNPATDMVTVLGIQATEVAPAIISLINTNGVVCLDRMVTSNEVTLSVATLSPGIYFCRVQTTNKKPAILKLIVTH